MAGRFGQLAGGEYRGLTAALTAAVGRALFPHFCLGCGEEGRLLCGSCLEGEDTRMRGVFWCPACGKENGTGRPCSGCGDGTEFSLSVSMSTYGRPVPQRLLQSWKYSGVAEAGEILNGLLAGFLGRQPGLPRSLSGFQAVPVPLHPFRLAERGFNQAEVIAGTAARAVGLPVRADVLIRRFQWHKQATIADPERRQANAAGSVAVRRGVAVPERALLVDDVMTTGATLSLCARTLKAAGCREVAALTVLRG